MKVLLCTWPATMQQPGRPEIAPQQLPDLQELVKGIFPPHSSVLKHMLTLQPSPQFGAYLPNRVAFKRLLVLHGKEGLKPPVPNLTAT